MANINTSYGYVVFSLSTITRNYCVNMHPTTFFNSLLLNSTHRCASLCCNPGASVHAKNCNNDLSITDIFPSLLTAARSFSFIGLWQTAMTFGTNRSFWQEHKYMWKKHFSCIQSHLRWLIHHSESGNAAEIMNYLDNCCVLVSLGACEKVEKKTCKQM